MLKGMCNSSVWLEVTTCEGAWGFWPPQRRVVQSDCSPQLRMADMKNTGPETVKKKSRSGPSGWKNTMTSELEQASA